MNVLIQTLSLLSQVPKTNSFKYSSNAIKIEDLSKYSETTAEYCCSSEPAVRSVIEELKALGERLNKIIVICSPETHSKSSINDNGNMITTLELYEKRLKCIFDEMFSDLDEVPDVEFKKIEGKDRVAKAESNTKTVIEIAEEIRNSFTADNNSRLYIDTQGGGRPDMFFLLSIVRLLGIHGIEPYRILHCEFSTDNKDFQPLYDKKKEYSVFDLPSGIDEFINYAKAKQLRKFFTESGDMENNKFIRETIEIIEDIANAIQICNMDDLRENPGKLNEKCSSKNDAGNEQCSRT